MNRQRAALVKGLRWGARLALVLGLIGGILLFSRLLTHWPTSPPPIEPPSPTVEVDALTASAATAVAQGNTARARQLLDETLAKAPRHAPALLLKTCIALESGPPREAEATLALLQQAAPERPEPRLLQRLLEHRARFHDQGWRHPFFRAWNELGRPNFKDSPLLPALDLKAPELFPSTEAWRHATSPDVRLTLVLAMYTLSEHGARWLIEQLPTLEDAGLIQAASVRLLSSTTLPPALQSQAFAAVRHRLERLVETSPDLLHPRLLLLLAQTPEWTPFSQQELESLEALTSRTTWQPTALSFSRTFLQARARLKEARHPSPGLRAFTVAEISSTHWAMLMITRRADKTRHQFLPGSRHLLGRVEWNLGAFLSQQSSLREHNYGLQFMAEGAADMGDEQEEQRLEQVLEEALVPQYAVLEAAPERWPLPSLWEEVLEARARDELAYFREAIATTPPPQTQRARQ